MSFGVKKNELILSAKDFGVKGDLTNGVCNITAGSPTLTTGANQFFATDVGKVIVVSGAGTPGAGISPDQPGSLITTILTYNAPGNVTLAANAGTTVTNATSTYGTDDTAALNVWAAKISTLIPGATGGGCQFAGFWPTGQYLVTGEITFGSATVRTDGFSLTCGGERESVKLFWCGASCDDGSTPGTYPKVNESVLHFRSLWGSSIKGGLSIETPDSTIYNRVGIWFDFIHNGGNNTFENFQIKTMMTAIYAGGPLAYTGGTWLAPTGWTSPAGQGNNGIVDQLVIFNCIEGFRLAGANPEVWLLRNTGLQAVKFIRTFNGRSVRLMSGDNHHAASLLPFPGQTPNDYYVVDAEGSGLGGGGAFTIDHVRQETSAALARIQGPGGSVIANPVNLIVNEFFATGTDACHTRTLTDGAMTAGSDILTSSSQGNFNAVDQGTIITVTGAGTAGATLTAVVRQVINTTTAHLSIAASTTVASATVNITGVTTPLKFVQYKAQGVVSLTNTTMPWSGSYISMEGAPSGYFTSVLLQDCLTANTTADSDPTSLVSVSGATNTASNGVEVTVNGCILIANALPYNTIGRISDRKFRITGADAANTTWQFLSKPETITPISSNYNVLYTDKTILATGGVSGITATLPVPRKGDTYVIKKVDAGAGAVTIATSSGTIDGASTRVLANAFSSVILTTDGTNWNVSGGGLENVGPGATGPIGSSSVTPIITIDAQGRVTALSSATITGAPTKTSKSVTGTISATTTIIPLVAAKRLKIYSITLMTASTSTVTATFNDGVAGTAMASYPMQAISGTEFGISIGVMPDTFLFGTTAGNALELNLSASQSVTYNVSYFDDDAT